MTGTISKGVVLAGTFLFFAATAFAGTVASVQLVGSVDGVACDPADPENGMERAGDHLWRKLQLVSGADGVDTVYFKFTKNWEYYPQHWGYDHVRGWGYARYDFDPPWIVSILDDGYYWFWFDDSLETYGIDRPTGLIEGTLTCGSECGVPDGAKIDLMTAEAEFVGRFDEFADQEYAFAHLPAGLYVLSASAPGYRDTTITGVLLGNGTAEWVPISLSATTGVMISLYACERIDGGVMISWCTDCGGTGSSFDVYRGQSPEFASCVKRNAAPVYSTGDFRYFDEVEDPAVDHWYFIVETGVSDPSVAGPLFVEGSVPSSRNALHQNYPNPFNPATTIPFSVGSGTNGGSPVRIAFYDVRGRLVDGYSLGVKPQGDHEFRWNPSLSGHRDIPSGVYYCRLVIGKESFTRKLILLR
ncbi:MAG: T9SS type A sorting domain-containing protein [Candidatus Krumholzibacteriota bacterium]|nr:T9SS type A sorting domain-containing protein [Candidatus Krumholzibacteriota bacterium]